MSKTTFFIPFLRNPKTKKFAEAAFLIPLSVYILTLPALALQGRILNADGLIPLEAGFCVFLSIITAYLASYKIKQVITT